MRLHEDEGLAAMIKHPTDYQLPGGWNGAAMNPLVTQRSVEIFVELEFMKFWASLTTINIMT